MSEVFQKWLKKRSIGEGGYSDGITQSKDPGNKSGSITVRGIITPTFRAWAKAIGYNPGNEVGWYNLQLSMLKGKNESNANIDYTLPNGLVVKSPTPLMKWGGFTIPSLSNSERYNPSNELYISLMKYVFDSTITNTALKDLDPGLQFIFADLEYAGGACKGVYLGFSDNTTYGWSSGFRQYLNRKYGKNISTSYSGKNLTKGDVEQINSIGSDVFDDYFDYAMLRFKGCNSKDTFETYKKGWENAARAVRDEALSLTNLKKNSFQSFASVKGRIFQNKGLVSFGFATFVFLIAFYLIPKLLKKK